jgi:glutaredoxin 3
VTNHQTIVIYTQVLCGYCAAARELLKDKGVTFTEIDVTMNPAKRGEMQERSGLKTVPQIFIGAQHVGGFDDLAALDDRGELDEMLAHFHSTRQG